MLSIYFVLQHVVMERSNGVTKGKTRCNSSETYSSELSFCNGNIEKFWSIHFLYSKLILLLSIFRNYHEDHSKKNMVDYYTYDCCIGSLRNSVLYTHDDISTTQTFLRGV